MKELKHLQWDIYNIGTLAIQLETIPEDAENREQLESELMIRLSNSIDGAQHVANFALMCVDRAETLKKRIDELKTMKDYYDRMEEKSRYAIKNFMEVSNNDKLEYEGLKISTRHSTSTEITDEKALPGEFVKVVTELKPDKKLIKEAIQKGEIVPGAQLKQNTSITIKGV